VGGQEYFYRELGKLKETAIFAEHVLYYHYIRGEIGGVIKGRTAMLEGASYEDAEKITLDEIRKTKLVSFFKVASVVLGVMMMFFIGLLSDQIAMLNRVKR